MGRCLCLPLYVDDMLIASRSLQDIADLKSKLHSQFDMKDLGDANCILGMRIKRDHSKKLLYLSQKPFLAYLKISKDDCPQSDEEKAKMAKIPYASACDSLMYAMVATRPNIAYAVGVVNRFMSNLGKKHWNSIK